MKIKQNFASTSNSSDESGVIPLINVVFLMLIFFMITGKIQKSDPVKVSAPSSISEKEAKKDPDALIILSLDNQLYLNNQATSMQDLRSALETLYAESTNKEAFWTLIKTDGSIPLEKIRPIFAIIRKMGLSKVSLATELDRG